MDANVVGGIVRAILAAAGGALVAKGAIDDATAQVVIGGVVNIVVAIWSYFTNRTPKAPTP